MAAASERTVSAEGAKEHSGLLWRERNELVLHGLCPVWVWGLGLRECSKAHQRISPFLCTEPILKSYAKLPRRVREGTRHILICISHSLILQHKQPIQNATASFHLLQKSREAAAFEVCLCAWCPESCLSCRPVMEDIGLPCDTRSMRVRQSCCLFSNEAKLQKVMK